MNAPIMDPRTRTLLEAPIVPTLVRLAAPNLLVMLIQAGVALVEAYFIGMLGTDALAGIALVLPLLMLTQMMSGGAMGGGISSAVARALGSGRRDDGNALVWHAVAIAVVAGLIFTLVIVGAGRWIYGTAMGASGASLEAALIYSNITFAGAIFIWLFNSLASVIRGTGNMNVPAGVAVLGAAVLIPASPLLIFGFGPIPAFGIAGGAVAGVAYYIVGCAALAFYIWTRRGLLAPRPTPPALKWALSRDILRVGLIACIITVTTNLSVAVATALVGEKGAAAIAGYGVGARLEYLLIPIAFGFGAPLVAMVGTAVGAGRRERALKVAWLGAAVCGLLTEAIGLSAAFFPHAWLSLFGNDPVMLDTGTRYLRIVGPVFGFFGMGMVLYFSSQGAGRLKWPLIGGLTRLFIATVGGWVAFRMTGNIDSIFAALAVGLVAFALINAASVYLGAWFTSRQ